MLSNLEKNTKPKKEATLASLPSDLQNVLLHERDPRLAQRCLCNTCAQYDWTWLLTRFEILDRLGLSDAGDDDVKKVSQLTGEKRVLFRTSGGSKEYRCHRHPFGGQYIVHGLRPSSLEFSLDKYSQIAAREMDCIICNLIVRALRVKTVMWSKHMEAILTNDVPIDVQIAKPPTGEGYPIDQTWLRFHIHFNYAAGNFRRNRYLNFTLWKRGNLETMTNMGLGDICATQADLSSAGDWLSDCLEHHEQCAKYGRREQSAKRNSQPDFVLRLIDVTTDEIIASVGAEAANMRYVALSYVWGGIEQPRLKKSDLITKSDDAANQGDSAITVCCRSLLQDKSRLPQTIRDAMLLVKIFGQQYFWVDSLCIVQDDDYEKSKTINAMYEVYSQALFTIMAAGGQNANSGLAGFRPMSRNIDSVNCVVGGVGLIMREPKLNFEIGFEEEDEGSVLNETPWKSRAWTYQEFLFSRRLLIFAKDRLFFQCRTYSRGEVSPQTNMVPWKPIERLAFTYLPAEVEPFGRFWLHVEEYSKRRLTNTDDIFNAFAAVFSSFAAEENYSFCWGLPEHFFRLGLLWEVHFSLFNWKKSITRRIAKINGVSIPTWSWAGWIGPITLNLAYIMSGTLSETGANVFDSNYVKKWSLEAMVPENTKQSIMETGILEFEAPFATVDHSLASEIFIIPRPKLDDGTSWTEGAHDCILIAERKSALGKTLWVMLVEEIPDKSYARIGVTRSLSELGWLKANPVKRTIRLS